MILGYELRLTAPCQASFGSVCRPKGAQRLQRHSPFPSNLLCYYHARQQLIVPRTHCPRKSATPDTGGGGPKLRRAFCLATTSAGFGVSASFPASGGLGGALGSLARYYYYYREILARAALTVGLLIVIRCGHFVPLPGVDLSQVHTALDFTPGERLIKAMYGQAQDLPASLFDLGLSPFLNASIMLAFLMMLPAGVAKLPYCGVLSRIQEARQEGRAGEAYLVSLINMTAVALGLWHALVRALELQSCAVFGGGGLFVPQTVLALLAGSACIHMCASTITSYGVGNGSTLVICSSIIREYAATMHTALSALDTSLLSPARLVILLGGYLALMLASVCLSTAELRLPVVQYATSAPPPSGQRNAGDGGQQDLCAQARVLTQKRNSERSQRSNSGGWMSLSMPGAAAGGLVSSPTDADAVDVAGLKATGGGIRPSSYFPILLNSNGIMSIMLGGAVYYGFLPKLVEVASSGAIAAAGLSAAQNTPLGLVGYGIVVSVLEFLPLGGVNPKEMSEYFGKMNFGIKGVVPGDPTEREIRSKLLKCKFWGGLCIGTLAVAAQLYDSACMQMLGTHLGTTSLLIIAGAVLQTARQIEGLLEGPKLQRKLDQERAVIQSLSLL